MPRSTIRDFEAIAKLKIVDAREHRLVTRDHSGSTARAVVSETFVILSTNPHFYR